MSEPSRPPVMDIVAGPQGSGKSTFFAAAGRGCDGFNIDDHRRVLGWTSATGLSPRRRRQALADYRKFISDH